MESNYIVCVISTQRAENVPQIQKFYPDSELVFFVSKNEGLSYKKFGAKQVVECERNISIARNEAILYCQQRGKYCVQTSDDLRGIAVVKNGKKEKCTTYEAIEDMIATMQETGAKLCGVAITDNLLNYKVDWRKDKLVVNDLIVIAPDNELLYDRDAHLKEDYDMFVMQMQKYGIVLRADKYMCRFPHRENKAGANTYRTYELEKLKNEYVMAKHEGIIVPHSRRENQVEINYKKLYADISHTLNQ
jgi:hypothetical protein